MAGAYHSVFTALGTRDPNTRLFTAGNLAGNLTSTTTQTIGMCPMASVTCTVETGTPSGSFFVDVTDDPRAEDPNGGLGTPQWVTLQQITFTSGLNNGNSAAHVTWANGAKYARVRWVQTGGTGTGFAFLTGVST